jgi:hypothetical protein
MLHVSYARTLWSLSELFFVRLVANIYEIRHFSRRRNRSALQGQWRHTRQHGKHLKCSYLHCSYSPFLITFLSSLFCSKLRTRSARDLIYLFKGCLLNDTLTSFTNIRLNVWMIMEDNEMARIWKEAITDWCRHLPEGNDKNYETRISTPVLNRIQNLPTIHLLCSRQFHLPALVSKLCFTWRRRLGRYTTSRAGASRYAGFIPDRGKMFLFFEPSRTALGPTQRVQTALSQRARRPGHEGEHSPPSLTTFRMPGGRPPLTFYLFL